jgi:glucose dehydrogenase
MSLQSRLICLSACLALGAGAATAADTDLAKLSKDAKNWTMQAGDLNNHRYSELKQITSKNAKDLQVAWTFSTGVLRGHEGGPLVIGDTMYVHSPFPNKVFALSLEDQSIRWKYEPKQDPTVIPVMCCDTVNRGLAYANGKIFLQQADTTLVALDAKSGNELWKSQGGRSQDRRNHHQRAARLQGQGSDRHQRRRVRRARTHRRLRHEYRQAGVESLQHRPGQ